MTNCGFREEARRPVSRSVRRLLTMASALLAMLSVTVARGDVEAMKAAIAHSPLHAEFSSKVIRPSLLTGFYSLYSLPMDGQKSPIVADEDLSHVMSGGSWLRLADGGKYVPMNAAEQTTFRERLFASVRLDQGIALRYGNGARSVVMISAYDCPSCRRLEKNLSKIARQVNATIYVFPIALSVQSSDAMARATELWCRPDAAIAWERAMQGLDVTDVRLRGDCGVRNAEAARSMMSAFGIKSVPTVVFENGEIRRDLAGLDEDGLAGVLNGEARPSRFAWWK
jgi:thiol:disulfide interchange protein DsbC